ncbi:MAG: hypothetical protein LC640_09810 [Frankia sp.]|nr:hypothetical protein [Frankia sp.]
MPDIEMLLAETARQAPLDLMAVDTRARVLARRRYAGQAGLALVAAALLAVPVARLLDGDGTARLRPIGPAPGGASPSRPVGAQRPPAGARGSRPGEAVAVQQPAGSQPPGAAPGDAAPSVLQSARASASPPPGGNGAFPRAKSCGVTTEGLLPGESRTCRFTAVTAGGWIQHTSGGLSMDNGYWVVRVYRGDSVIDNPDDTGAGCANDGIRRGDRVEVTITQHQSGYTNAKLYAGDGYRCGSRV